MKKNVSAVAPAKSKSFVKGALILGAAGFIGKFLGAVYRIPLTNIVGAEGMGLYQMVFPLYTLLLTVSSSGLPAAISRLIAEKNALDDKEGARKILGTALITLTVFGALSSAAVICFSGGIARLQGNGNAALAYAAIAPSVLFVAIICAFRGYFQGKQNMVPSAVSQLIEQGGKMAAGLALSYFLLPRGLEWAIFGALIGVSISELLAMLVLAAQYFAERDRLKPLYGGRDFRKSFKNLYGLSIPVTLGGIIMPVVQLIDSALVINILTANGYVTPAATALYGIATGPVNSLINMPVVLSLAIASAVVPNISSLRVKADTWSISKNAALALKMTMFISVPCMIGFAVMSAPIINLLYSGGLHNGVIDEPRVAAALLAISSVCVILIAFIQVTTSLMQGMNRNYRPVINLLIGAVIKIVSSVLLLPVMGIYGSAVSTILCFLTAFVLNAISLARTLKLRLKVRGFLLAPILSGALMGATAYFVNGILASLLHPKLAVIMAIAAAGAVYFAGIMLFGGFDYEEGRRLPLVRRLYRKNG
ncbi:MAG: polysaccharide biosynthesis protein [Clostridiales bacterium]|jgi:stage V sporulation protein B|nr:polysaccharide biosynthesis protein [Clostridiales bacterium]